MFSFFNRSRRHVAVLAALAMLASVLVAAPAVAADDPLEQDYTATYSACVGVDESGFTDVPAGHANAGDIDCIAYYGITQGTSATTYSPLMSVTREHMALFLTRLAGIVEIPMASDPADPGFTDTGDLSEKSQTAIAQLADLGITQGTSATTYSPADAVKRHQMALFISRLMNLMDPMAEDKDTAFGYTPEDVVDVDDGDDADDLADKTVGTPFTDLRTVTVTAYDAITALWELGVASGISDTAYAPSVNITRAAMAEFMAGVLDHSNARPAGITIQADKTWEFGDFDPAAKIAVSYRDDNFAPMVDVSIKTFYSGNDVDTGGVGSFNEDGGCSTAAECSWTDDESLTDDSGNIYLDGNVSDGLMNTYYAWMGDPDEDENDFDVDASNHASVTLSSTTDAVNLKVTTDINENSTNKNTVDIDATDSVTLTAQLVDSDGEPVAKSGVEIDVAVMQGTQSLYPGPAPLETDDDGKVTYTTSGPKSTKDNNDVDRTDTVRFSADVDDNDTLGDPDSTDAANPSENVTALIFWTDSDPTLVTAAATTDDGDSVSREANGSGKGSTDPYAFLSGQGKATIRATVTFYDQYGNTAGKNSKVLIDVGAADPVFRTLSSRGAASWTATLELADTDLGGVGQTVAYALQDPAATDPGSPQALADAPLVTSTMVVVVRHADDDSSRAAADIDDVYGDENRFRIGGALYSYDSDDVFLNTVTADGVTTNAPVDMAKFESLIGANLDAIGTEANIVVVSYDDDGSSIFRVATPAS